MEIGLEDPHDNSSIRLKLLSNDSKHKSMVSVCVRVIAFGVCVHVCVFVKLLSNNSKHKSMVCGRERVC